MNKQNKKEQEWEKEVYRACFSAEMGADMVRFIRQLIQRAKEDGYAKCKDELLKLNNLENWVVDKAYQDGYSKGRVKCLEQHFSKELQQARAEVLKEVLKKIKGKCSLIDEIIEKEFK